MSMKDAIKIPYPGSCISVNHYLGRKIKGGYYVKPEAKAFKEELQWYLKHCHIEDYTLPLEVTCSGWFKNERAAPDLSNLSKVILDAIQELTGWNDKDFRWRDGERTIGVKEPPYLLITIHGSEPQPLPEATESKSSGVKDKTRVKHQRRILCVI